MLVSLPMNRRSMPGIEPFNLEGGETSDRPDKRGPVTSRKIKPSKSPLGEHGIPGYECLLVFEIEADAARSMPGGMEDGEWTDPITIGKEAVRGNARRP